MRLIILCFSMFIFCWCEHESQVEGVRLFDKEFLKTQLSTTSEAAFREYVAVSLHRTIEQLIATLFGVVPMRWVDAYFPFTHPSWELEIFYKEKWMEVLGCGLIQDRILENSGNNDKLGWAFGLGLERLAMVLFGIPDIRLFWSKDPRFLNQFSSNNKKTVFVPYSKYPECFKDLSMWVNENFHENDLFADIRAVAGDLVEEVKFQSEFKDPKSGRTSRCYRIVYRSMDRNLTNEEIDQLQFSIRNLLCQRSTLTLR